MLSHTPDLKPDLQGAILYGAQLQGVDLFGARLQGAILIGAQLQKAGLGSAQLRGVDLSGAQLRGADLSGAQLQQSNLRGAQLQGADLRGVFFDNATSLNNVILGDEKYGGDSLADVRWGGVNLAVVDWSPLKMLGDEYQARRLTRLGVYRIAVRANRQLAVVLRDQGLNEEADHFAYRARLLQRVVWRHQQKWLKYSFSWFLFLLAGYGYRPLRSVCWYLGIIVGFALTYYAFGHLSLFPPDAFVYSLASFHGRGGSVRTQSVTMEGSRKVGKSPPQ